MTRLLEQAIDEVRSLSEEEQDAAATALFAHLARDHHHRFGLTDGQIEEVRRIQRDLREGHSSLASQAEMAALWRKCGL